MKITSKDYRHRKIHTVPIDNNQDFRTWLSDKFVERNILLQDNRVIFRKLFGKPHWHFRTEFDFHVWVLEHDNETYLILTAKGKGTAIEMVRPEYRGVESKSRKIISFAEFLLGKINERQN